MRMQCRLRLAMLTGTGLLIWALASLVMVAQHTNLALLPANDHITKMDSVWRDNTRLLLRQQPATNRGAAAAATIDWPDDDSVAEGPAEKGRIDVKGHTEEKSLLGNSRAVLPVMSSNGVPKMGLELGVSSEPIDCIINDDEGVVPCLHSDEEIYLPFSFVKSYFEVYGELITGDEKSSNDGDDEHHSKQHAFFQLRHAKQEVYAPSAPYSSRGSFLFFEHYNVAEREKVLCISGKEGVPVSNQWDRNGYYYPIQIVQYGLSHYSQYIERGPDSDAARVVEAGNSGVSAWVLSHEDQGAVQVVQEDKGENVVQFNVPSTAAETPYVPIRKGTTIEVCLTFDVKFLSRDASVIVALAGDAAELTIEYTASETLINIEGNRVEYGLSDAAIGTWKRVRRDIHVDVRKAVQLQKRGRIKAAVTAIAVQLVDHIAVKGRGLLDNVTLANTCHMGHFLDAADWIVRNQDSKGGWPIPVRRSWRSLNATLMPGWYSAMAQGHALSILSRAHAVTKDLRYARAARRALAVYQTVSSRGGVQATFMGQHTWYEEYPTTPPLFVLNGFIYSLFGLYDMKESMPTYGKDEEESVKAAEEADSLWKAGLRSLKVMLPFYDSGTGSFYDLRHCTMGVAPNRARWDYHAVHVGQLHWLGTMDTDPLFNATAARWHDYMRGHLAPHN